MEYELPTVEPAGGVLVDHLRCAPQGPRLTISKGLSEKSGFFRFGSGNILFGRCAGQPQPTVEGGKLEDIAGAVRFEEGAVCLPFDPCQALDNLRWERYRKPTSYPEPPNGLVRTLYYHARPFLGVGVRKHLQRIYFRSWQDIPFPRWPVDVTVESTLEHLLALWMRSQGVGRLPFIWFWPQAAPSCAIVTHDVETAAGRDFCCGLMDLNDSFAIKSSFQVVPEERYTVPQGLLDTIRQRGFELNIQDLNHDGLLFRDRSEFLRRARLINHYAETFRAQGFRAAVLYRNPDWYGALKFSYDMSIPNVAHLDPQRGGCCTVLPYFIGDMVELPVTLTQDYSLFHILNNYSITLWQEQIERIRQKHGLISVIIHPDYILTERPRRVYTDLLRYLSELRAKGETWIALPGEVAAWWRQRNQMTLVPDGHTWRIQGAGSERATVAYATLCDDDTIRYELLPAGS